jgi:hypothetical protein
MGFAIVFTPQEFFRLDDGERVKIRHDHGFLDDGKGGIDETKRISPSVRDRLAEVTWHLKLFGARMFRSDLQDAVALYGHYLGGTGTPYRIDLNRYFVNDPSGRTAYTKIVDTMVEAVLDHYRETRDTHFKLRSDVIPVREACGVPAGLTCLPYPKTENWQKTLGAFALFAWVEASIRSQPKGAEYYLRVRIEAEDRYNFNPGQHDLATKIPDSANGRFQLTGQAREFMVRGRLEQGIVLQTSGDAIVSRRTLDPSERPPAW